jgi:hypothetical protein
MTPKNTADNINTESIRAARSIALSIAGISIALAAFCLALLSFNNQSSSNLPTSFDKVVALSLLILGTVFIFTASLSLDWIIDRFEMNDWKAVLGDDMRPDFQRNDQFPLRFGLFNHGYFILCMGIAVLSFIILFQGIHELALPNSRLYPISIITSVLWSVYVVLQMMTFEKIKVQFGLIAIGAVLTAVVFSLIV